RKAGYLSGGEQQMLAIGRALMSGPRLLMLDEPSLGLAPKLVKEIFGHIKRLNAELGLTVLVIEQNARRALDVADRGYIMEQGRIVLDGAARDLKENPDVKEFYLGLGDEGTRKSSATSSTISAASAGYRSNMSTQQTQYREHADNFNNRLKATIRAAAELPAFAARLQAAGLRPEQIGGPEDLVGLPIQTKDEVMEAQLAKPPFGGMLAADANVTRVFQSPGPLYEPQLAGVDPWRWAEALQAAGIDARDTVLNCF